MYIKTNEIIVLHKRRQQLFLSETNFKDNPRKTGIRHLHRLDIMKKLKVYFQYYIKTLKLDLTCRVSVYHIQFETMMRPWPELQGTVLCIKREILNIDSTYGFDDCREIVRHWTGIRNVRSEIFYSWKHHLIRCTIVNRIFVCSGWIEWFLRYTER